MESHHLLKHHVQDVLDTILAEQQLFLIVVKGSSEGNETPGFVSIDNLPSLDEIRASCAGCQPRGVLRSSSSYTDDMIRPVVFSCLLRPVLREDPGRSFPGLRWGGRAGRSQGPGSVPSSILAASGSCRCLSIAHLLCCRQAMSASLVVLWQ